MLPRVTAPPTKRPDARALAELDAVAEIGKVLTSTLELPEVLKRILERVREILRPRRWSLLLVDETGRLRFEVVVGDGAEALRGRSLEPGEGVAGWVQETGEALHLADAGADPRWTPRFDDATGVQTRSLLAVPLSVRDRCLGVLELVAGPEDRPFDEDDLRVLSYVADYAAIAIDNARNYEQIQALTVLDEHTGLYNARHLFRTLQMEAERTRRYLHPVSLIFLDLDRFKTVNDTHGHLAGSALLREVGEVIRAGCRSTDVGCRYGGDEFAVALPETALGPALDLAERLRQAVRERRFLADRGLAVQITASFGVATFPDHADTVEGLVREADRAMYAVKAAGRDGVRAATETSS